MTVQYTTIRVRLSGNGFYPKVIITRDNHSKEYWISSEYDLKRIQLLFDIHRHQGRRIYVDIENSAIELTKEKSV